MNRSAVETSGARLTASVGVIAQKLDLAFHDLQQATPNKLKLVAFAQSHYVNSLNASGFRASLQQRRLNPASKVILQQFVDNFFLDLRRLYTEHSMMEKKLEPMIEIFTKQLDAMDVIKKGHSVFFNGAAMICSAVVIIAVNAKRPWIGAAAAAASILFIALGKWRQSALKKDETAVKKQKEITEHMLMGAQLGMRDLLNIFHVARRLVLDTESLSEAIDDGERAAAAVRVSFEEDELLKNVKVYSDSMKWAKREVLLSLRGA